MNLEVGRQDAAVVSVQEAGVSSRMSSRSSVGPYAGKAQLLRSTALAAIASHRAARRRRHAQRWWVGALLTSAGITAGVFQSCSGGPGARDVDAASERPLLFGDKARSGRDARTRGGAGRPDETDAPGRSAFDQAATDLQALFDQMGQQSPGSQTGEAPNIAGADDSLRPAARRSSIEPAGARGETRSGVPDAPTEEFESPTPEPTVESSSPVPDAAPVPPPGLPALNHDPASGAGDPAGGTAGEAVLPAAAPQHVESSMLALPTVALCTRVESFGRYTPFGGNRFLAGRVNPAIVYAEVEHFTQLAATDLGITSLPDLGTLDAGSLLVELSIATELFHADGSRQWRSGEAIIRDHARTRRRDFYVVQWVDLPANLSVGRYNLKITLRDRLSPDRAEIESVLPIEIVADAGLLGEGRSPQLQPSRIATALTPRAPVAGPEPARR